MKGSDTGIRPRDMARFTARSGSRKVCVGRLWQSNTLHGVVLQRFVVAGLSAGGSEGALLFRARVSVLHPRDRLAG